MWVVLWLQTSRKTRHCSLKAENTAMSEPVLGIGLVKKRRIGTMPEDPISTTTNATTTTNNHQPRPSQEELQGQGQSRPSSSTAGDIRVEKLSTWTLPSVIGWGNKEDEDEEDGCSLEVRPAIFPDGKTLALVHENGRHVVLLDVNKNGGPLCKLEGHTDKVKCLAVTCDGEYLITGGADKTLRIWELKNDLQKASSEQVIYFDDEIVFLSTHPSSRMFFVGLRGNVVLLRHVAHPKTDQLHVSVKDCNVTCIAQGEDHVVYGTHDGRIYVWTYEVPKNPVGCIRASENCNSIQLLEVKQNLMASWADTESHVCIWETQKGNRLCQVGIDYNYLSNMVIMGNAGPGNLALAWCREDEILSSSLTDSYPQNISNLDSSVLHLLVAAKEPKLVAITASRNVAVHKLSPFLAGPRFLQLTQRQHQPTHTNSLPILQSAAKVEAVEEQRRASTACCIL